MLGYRSTMGARKKGKKKSAGGSCRRGTIRFKTKRGKVVQFQGKTGPGCGPRPKPSTRHLARYQKALASAARACKGRSAKQFRSCVRTKMK